jgi:hypothetical protein
MSVLCGLALAAGGSRGSDGSAPDLRGMAEVTIQLDPGEEFLVQLRAFKRASLGNYTFSFGKTDGKTFFDVYIKHTDGRWTIDVCKASAMDIRLVRTPTETVLRVHLKDAEIGFMEGGGAFFANKTWDLPLP